MRFLKFGFPLTIWFSVLASAVGCAEKPQSGNDFYGGVRLADKSGYFCIPLRTLSVPEELFATSVTTNCECVTPQLIRYFDETGQYMQAVLVEYKPGSEQNARGRLLKIELAIELADGTERQFTLTVMDSSIAP